VSVSPGGPRRRLLVVVTTDRRRGAEVQAERTTRAMVGLGWSPRLVSLSASPGPRVDAAPLSDRRPEGLRGLRPGLVRRLRREIRSEAPDALLAWGSATLRYVAVAGLAMRRRPLLAYVAIGSPGAWVDRRIQVWRYRLLAARYDVVVAVAESVAAELVAQVGVPRERIRVVPSGVPRDLLGVERETAAGPLRVLFVGRLSAEKDPLLALEAAARVIWEGTDAVIRFVGGGPLAAELRRRAERLGVEERVELVGPVPDVRPHLAWGHLLLLTSRTEGLAGVVLEAGAAGLPVVATRVGGIAEALDGGRSGILVDRDVAAVAAAVRRLATEPALRHRLGEAGREIVAGRFLVEHAAAGLDRVLRRQV